MRAAANMLLKFKFGLIFFCLLSAASLFSISLAARRTPQFTKGEGAVNNVVAHHQEVAEDTVIHERLLKVNTKDYGRYDPAPALVRPPFKLIPN